MKRRAASLVAAYAIALQAVLGVWSGALQFSYDPVLAVLCSELAGDVAQGPATPGHQHPTECPCATLCFGGGTTGVEPETVALAHPRAATSAMSPVASATEHHSAPRGPAQPRAPPVSV